MGRLKDLKFWDSCMPTKLELNVRPLSSLLDGSGIFFCVAGRIQNLSF